jgi:hypothetical protein
MVRLRADYCTPVRFLSAATALLLAVALLSAAGTPGPPTSLSATVVGRTVVLTWTAPAGGDPPTAYVVEAGSASGLSDLANADTGSSTASLTATNVASGAYFVRVRARNGSGTSAPSNEIVVVVDGGIRWSPSDLIVETIAGTGSISLGDGGDGRQAVLANPWGLTALPDGALLIADSGNNRIRRLGSDGIITTVAGTGSGHDLDLGNDGPATSAVLRIPRDTALGPDGSAYIGDANHYQVRRVDPQGLIHAFAGNRNFFYAGDGGPATQASFTTTISVAVDASGNVYVADQVANRVRRVGRDGIILTVAGTGEPGSAGESVPGTQGQVNSPRVLRIRDRTKLVIGSGPGVVRELDLATGLIRTLISQTGLQAIAPDGTTDLVVASANQVARWRAATGNLTVIAGTGQAGFSGDGGFATDARFDGIAGLAADALGRIFISDANNQRVRQIGTDGRVQTIAGGGPLPGDNVPGLNANIYDALGLARDALGNLYFTDYQNHLIRRLGTDGRVTTVAGTRRVGAEGSINGAGGHPLQADLCNPQAVAVDPYGQVLFNSPCGGTGTIRLLYPGADGVVNGGSDERIIDIAGQASARSLADRGRADGQRATLARFDTARDFALDSRGNLYIADNGDYRVRMVTPGADGVFNGSADEIITTVAGRGEAVSDGDGGPANRAGVITGPIAIDSRDNLYIVGGNGQGVGMIRRVDLRTGIITTAGRIWINVAPQGLVRISPVDTLVYAQGYQLFEFDPRTGRSALIAGTGADGFGGDGGPATAASFGTLGYFSVERDGRIFLADNSNFRLRLLRPR